MLLEAVEPIWMTKPQTASRVRGRIEAILDWAKARGYWTEDNPARWRGHLQNLLPRVEKGKRIRHHPSLPYAEINPFVTELREFHGIGARALEFTILTAARPGEVIGATWDEIDLTPKVWVIPAERMRGQRVHRVPLSKSALAVLAILRDEYGASDDVFKGACEGKPLSNIAMLAVLRRMKRIDLTPHFGLPKIRQLFSHISILLWSVFP
jgi:integrase